MVRRRGAEGPPEQAGRIARFQAKIGIRHPQRMWGVAVSAFTLVAALYRLGDTGLWIDEAVSGLLGANILKFGLPRVANGPLVIHTNAPDGLWIWDGWLQAYMSAAGEAIFGRTAFGARFFHALAGALVPWAAYPLFRNMSARKGVAEAATLLTGLSVPLLFFARQAHYYPEGILLTILVIRAYRAVLASRRYGSVGLVIAAVLLYHANFAWFGILGTALALHLVVLRPPKAVAARLVSAGLVALAIVAPFAVWTRIWDRDFAALSGTPPPMTAYAFFAGLRHYLQEFNLLAAPVVLLLLGGAVAAGRRWLAVAVSSGLGVVLVPIVLAGPATAVAIWLFGAMLAATLLLGIGIVFSLGRQPKEMRGWMPGVLLTLVFLVWLLGMNPLTPGVGLRHVAPLFPLLSFLTAASVFVIFRRSWLAWPVIALLLATNALSVWPVRFSKEHVLLERTLARNRSPQELRRVRLPSWTGVPNLGIALGWIVWSGGDKIILDWRSPLRDYIESVRHPVRNRVLILSEYLSKRKQPGDRFTIVGESPYPLAYHTGLIPVSMGRKNALPRFFIEGCSWKERIIALQWLHGRDYRKVTLKHSERAPRGGSHSDQFSHLLRLPDREKCLVLWERVGPREDQCR